LSKAFKASLNTKYPIEEKIVGGYDMSRLSEAPLRALLIAKLDLPRQDAFDLMLSGLHKWFPNLEEFTWSNTRNGKIVVGSVRTGKYKGDKMVEYVRYIKPGHFYVYQIDLDKTEKFIPISNHMGVFTVEELPNHSSLVIWRQYFDSRIPLMGSFVAWIMEDWVAQGAFDNLVEIYGGQRIKY